MADVASQLRAWKELSRKSLQRAAARSLNRTATSVRAEATQRVRQEISLKSGDVKDTMTIRKATASMSLSKMVALLDIKIRAIPLFKFGAAPKKVKTPAGQRVGVTVKVKKQRKLVPGAFIATLKSGKQGVFWRGSKTAYRKDAGRFPIHHRLSTSVADVFKGQGFIKDLQAYARETFRKNFSSELKYESQKQRKKG